jgi:hypothetical protein
MTLNTNRKNRYITRKAEEDMAVVTEEQARYRQQVNCSKINTDSKYINDILKGQTIIGFIKNKRLNWLGHVERTAEDDDVQKIKRWKPMSKRPIGRPLIHWEDDVLEDIKSMNVRNWKKVGQNKRLEESS